MNVFECIWMYLASFLPINIFQGWFLVTFWRFQPKEMFRTLAFEKRWNWYQAFHHPSAYLGSCQIGSRSRRNWEGWKIWFIVINIHSDVLTPFLVFSQISFVTLKFPKYPIWFEIHGCWMFIKWKYWWFDILAELLAACGKSNISRYRDKWLIQCSTKSFQLRIWRYMQPKLQFTRKDATLPHKDSHCSTDLDDFIDFTASWWL